MTTNFSISRRLVYPMKGVNVYRVCGIGARHKGRGLNEGSLASLGMTRSTSLSSRAKRGTPCSVLVVLQNPIQRLLNIRLDIFDMFDTG